MKLYVKGITKNEVKSLIENDSWKIENMISFFVHDYCSGRTIQVFGAGRYGSYGEEGASVEVVSAKSGRHMLFGQIVDYVSLSDFKKGVKTYYIC